MVFMSTDAKDLFSDNDQLKIDDILEREVQLTINNLVTKKTDKIKEEKTKFKKIDWEEHFKDDAEADKIRKKLKKGVSINPCGKDCVSLADLVIRHKDHKSIENFKQHINDKEYLLHAAKITYNPKDCENFFYEYINKFLKNDQSFKLEFLRSLILNENVLSRDEIVWFVEKYKFKNEFFKLVNSSEFKDEVQTIMQENKINYINKMSSTLGIRKTDANNEYNRKVDIFMDIFKNTKSLNEKEDKISAATKKRFSFMREPSLD